MQPLQIELTLTPCSRYDAIDVASQAAAAVGEALAAFPRALYCSFHTTAGYLDQRLLRRLGAGRERLDPFIATFRRMFPEGADYRHDQLHLRTELSEEERRVEPRNADSHLAFILSGMRNCVTYANRPGEPVYFIDLDGVTGAGARQRRTSVVGFSAEVPVARQRFEVPVSGHLVDSVNLADPRVGLLAAAEELARRHGIGRGRLDIALEPGERSAAVTVNEYETLLMRHDLADVLQDPLRHLARQGRRMLADPRAIAVKTLGYARYDVVQLINAVMDGLRISHSSLERLLARVLALPAERLLRRKRAVSLLLDGAGSRPLVVRGRYQSPILVQWAAAPRRARALTLTLTELV